MREKDQLFAGPILIAFAVNIFCVFDTMNAYQNPVGAWSGGSLIQMAVYSFSPLLAFIMPFLMIAVLYKVYRRSENIGLILGGVWFGIEGFDLIVRLFSHISEGVID